jgi:hypothetical protein
VDTSYYGGGGIGGITPVRVSGKIIVYTKKNNGKDWQSMLEHQLVYVVCFIKITFVFSGEMGRQGRH